VDVTPPIATFRAPPDNLTVTSSSTARFYFTVDDSPVTTFCSVAGDPFAPCPSPFATRSLSDGTYTVSVFARDAVGNQGPTDNFTFTIDTHAPIISIPVPPNLTTTTENTPTFIFSDVGPLGTPVIFQCRVDGGAPVLCISTFTVASPLAEGNHTFTVTATDAAGNIGQASFSFLVDTVPPVVTLTGVPPSPTHEQHPAFAFTVTGANPGSNQCSLDNGATVLNNCTTPFVPTVTDGQHTVTIRATDAAGNVGEASFAFTVDTAAPVVTIPDPPTNPTTANTATPTLFFQVANTPSTTPIVASQCRVTDASAPHAVRAQSPPNVICDASFHVPLANSLTDGPYLFEVIATDAAGNVGSASFSFVVDTNAPNVFILSPPDHTIFTTSTPSFDFNVVENGPGTLVTTQCRIYTSIVMMPPPLVSCTSPFTSSSLSDGNYFFEVVATDAAGNIGNRFLPFGINTTGNSAPVSVATAEDIITVPRP
jgi:hypothetical protein